MGNKFILLRPGIDPIEEYAENPPRQRPGCGMIVVLTLALAVLLVGRAVFAGLPPNQTPIPSAAVLPSATPTPSLTPSPTASATPSPTASATASPTSSVIPSLTPTPTITPTPTVTPLPWITGRVFGASQLNVRYGPGVAWPAFSRLALGDVVRIVGRDNGARWGVLESGGWVSLAYVLLEESAARLPVVIPPPPVSIGEY